VQLLKDWIKSTQYYIKHTGTIQSINIRRFLEVKKKGKIKKVKKKIEYVLHFYRSYVTKGWYVKIK